METKMIITIWQPPRLAVKAGQTTVYFLRSIAKISMSITKYLKARVGQRYLIRQLKRTPVAHG